MSLKRIAMNMALAFAAAKGYQAVKQRGGLSGLKDMLAGATQPGGNPGTGTRIGGRADAPASMQAGGQTGGQGGLGGLMGALGGGGGAAGGGLGGLLGALGGAGGGTAGGTGGLGGLLGGAGGGAQGGLGGILGGLAAMAGGTAAVQAGGQSDPDSMMQAAQAGPADEATAGVMVRAIGQAVRADGQIDAREREILMDVIGEADTEDERAAIDAALSEPVDPEALARDVPRGHEAEVYAAALTAIDPDAAAERAFLGRFAQALGLDADTVRQLHAATGKLS